MLKKVQTDQEFLIKLDLNDYSKYLSFTQTPDFKFRISFFDTRTDAYNKRRLFALEEAKRFFPYRRVLCILYDQEENEANIVLKANR